MLLQEIKTTTVVVISTNPEKRLELISRPMPKLVYTMYKVYRCHIICTIAMYRHRLTIQRNAHALARLYCANLPLRVETGRYRNIATEIDACVHRL